MRILLATVSVLSLAACSAEGPDTYLYQSTFDHPSRGVVLHNDGRTGHAGMARTNCPYETATGSVTGDYNLPGENEELQHHGISPLGPNTIVATIGDTVWTLDKTTGDYVVDSVELPGVDRARLTDSGIVATVGTGDRCDVAWTAHDGSVPLDACPPQHGFAADPLTSTALAATGELAIATPEGLVHTGLSADMVAWDSALALAYVATAGSETLSAVDLDGNVVWVSDTGFPIDGFAAQGDIGRVAVMHDTLDGRGLLAMYQGSDGSLVGDAITPERASTVIASADGSVVGVVLDQRAHFFETDPRLR